MQPPWPERRRRWFLIAFSASVWLFLTNALAAFGDGLDRGGIGVGAFALCTVIGAGAVGAILASTSSLRFTRFAIAVLAGFGVAHFAQAAGLVDVAAGVVHDIECDDGSGAACAALADHYDSGRSFVGGSSDATLLRRRACALGGPGTEGACTSITWNAPRVSCEDGNRSACVREGRELESRGAYMESYERFQRACALADSREHLDSCLPLMNSGFPNLRAEACTFVEETCAHRSWDRECSDLLVRCSRDVDEFLARR